LQKLNETDYAFALIRCTTPKDSKCGNPYDSGTEKWGGSTVMSYCGELIERRLSRKVEVVSFLVE